MASNGRRARGGRETALPFEPEPRTTLPSTLHRVSHLIAGAPHHPAEHNAPHSLFIFIEEQLIARASQADDGHAG